MLNDQNVKTYFNGRLAAEVKREKTWRHLTQYYFNKKIKTTDLIVEIGAGWCDFINNIACETKYASDIWPGVLKNAGPNVKAFVSDASDFAFLMGQKADVIFASNVFEHLSRDKLDEVISSIIINLNESGRLIILQPNFRLNPGRYFDDYTHVSIWTDVSMCAYLEAKGMKIQTCKPKFLPLTVKSKIPVIGFLVKLYLVFPIKFQAGQMLIIATKN